MRLWLEMTLVIILICVLLLFIRSSKRKDARSGDVITTILQIACGSLTLYIIASMIQGIRILSSFIIGE